MRKVLSLFVTLAISVPTLAIPIRGQVFKQQDTYVFLNMETQEQVPIRVRRSETWENLKKLQNLDYFQGDGAFLDGELYLNTIDFVGLRGLLGLWSADKASFLNFQDFSKVTLITNNPLLGASRSQFQYSIAPSSGLGWKIFFSDAKSVGIATLDLGVGKAVLFFHDTETGQVVKTLEMSRMIPRN